jgi:hypothetical protein
MPFYRVFSLAVRAVGSANELTEEILQIEIWEGRLDVKAGEPGN